MTAMKLSVVIVNYNVKEFLEQCLLSVQKAFDKLDGEIIVVDNNSVDGSCQMVRTKFPEIRLIENSENKGFSKANNQAIKEAQGEYILLLNPDTLVEEDSFEKCAGFMDKHHEVGALGVKMLDGKGNFLKESKRGLPSPWVALYRITGLSNLFPTSAKFARYYLGHLPPDQINEVEILSGAFMFLRKAALAKSGLLDEDFFMYGEDIDLSYRIVQQGYKNIYFPETKIIHYKGESTKKGSLNYVKLFYKAMLIFSQKHFAGKQHKLFNLCINFAIYLRAVLSLAHRIIAALLLPILDFLIIFLGLRLAAITWENLYFQEGHFPDRFFNLIIPAYATCWLISIALCGAYRKQRSLRKLMRGIVAGSAFIIVTYSFLNESFRFSRALILFGSAWTITILPLFRYLLSLTPFKHFKLKENRRNRVIIIASSDEARRIENLLQNSSLKFELTGLVSPTIGFSGSNYLGSSNQIKDIVAIHKPDELIFSGKDISASETIDCMLDLSGSSVQFKIAPQESLSIIGSNSPNSSGELYQLQTDPVNTNWNRFRKRFFDLKVAGIILSAYPFWFLFHSRKQQLFRNSLDVFTGKKSWIGYASPIENDPHLPPLKKGILTPSSPVEESLPEAIKLKNDQFYAKNYRLLTDLSLVFRNRKLLSR